MFSFAAFAGDFTCFGDKPKTVADSDSTCEACYPNNLAWFLVIGPMLPVVTSRMFSTSMQNLDPSVFADADANTYADADFNADADGNFDPDADTDVDLDADTDVDPNLDANTNFELIFLQIISITTKEQLCIFVWMYVYVPFGLMKTSLYRLELGLYGYFGPSNF
ncbi:hypothetical protein H5410_037248 [Solanum commersonii]|uniref:Uncharacterized protein n=1 Tax=Solanum commersonii TaxID=4109 RepID=A0A9J5Y8Z0_SOLCO|nr:hypothetical protein H5410_037248 [Solanum commersonii]